MKKCSKCGIEKPLEAFRKNNRVASGIHSWCKICSCEKENARYRRNREHLKARMRERYWKDPEKTRARERSHYADNKAQHRRNRLKRLFQISVEDYEVMLHKQDGVCAICRQPESLVRGEGSQSLSIDHDHNSGRVRGLLCANCNSGLGMFRDSPAILTAAKTYLMGHTKE